MANLNGLWKDENSLLDEAKQNKKRELSRQCEEAILSGFEVEILGRDYHFSYDQEAQMNFQETMRLFENNLIEELNWTAHLNDEYVRLKLNKGVFEQIYLASVKEKLEKISYLRDELSPQVEAARNQKELDEIEWDFKSSERVRLNTENTLEKRVAKVDDLERETQAQKQYNTYMESSLMEVIDLTFMF